MNSLDRTARAERIWKQNRIGLLELKKRLGTYEIPEEIGDSVPDCLSKPKIGALGKRRILV